MPSLRTGGSNLNLTLSHFALSFITQAGPLVLLAPLLAVSGGSNEDGGRENESMAHWPWQGRET